MYSYCCVLKTNNNGQKRILMEVVKYWDEIKAPTVSQVTQTKHKVGSIMNQKSLKLKLHVTKDGIGQIEF